MKSKIHEFQENNFLLISKKSFIYLGIAVVAFTNITSALNRQQSVNNEYFSLIQVVQSDETTNATTIGIDSIEKKTEKAKGDVTGINPETIVSNPYTKTIEQIIAENNQIIENVISDEVVVKTTEIAFTEDDQISLSIISEEVGPVYSTKTAEEIILEDCQIIESPVINVIPLCAIKKSSKS